MKQIFLLGLVALSFFLASCNKPSIVGKWRDVGISNGGFIEFTSDGHFTFYNRRVKPRRGTYTTDDSKSPAYLDMFMDANNVNPDGSSKGKSFSAAGIYKIEENKLTIKSANGTDVANIHPSDFSESAGYLIIPYERFEDPIPMEYQTEYESPAQIEGGKK